MNNEELKKKLVETIINAIWKDAEADYDSTDESEARTIADALIAAGIGFDKSHLATFQELDTKLRVAEHHTKVAERALLNLCVDIQPYSLFDLTPLVTEASVKMQEYLQQAEKELTEEGRDGNGE